MGQYNLLILMLENCLSIGMMAWLASLVCACACVWIQFWNSSGFGAVAIAIAAAFV